MINDNSIIAMAKSLEASAQSREELQNWLLNAHDVSVTTVTHLVTKDGVDEWKFMYQIIARKNKKYDFSKTSELYSNRDDAMDEAFKFCLLRLISKDVTIN